MLKQLELSAAVRYDHYSDAGSSTTPKVGIKYTPIRQLALRATYAQGFRAPSSAENGTRRPGGVLDRGRSAALRPRHRLRRAARRNVAIITSPNPALKPEKSDNYTLGLVFEPTSKTSIALDYFDITRKDEINQELTERGDRGRPRRRAIRRRQRSSRAIPGAITAVLGQYVNSSKTKVRGFDLDAKQGVDLGGSLRQADADGAVDAPVHVQAHRSGRHARATSPARTATATSRTASARRRIASTSAPSSTPARSGSAPT